LNNLAPIVVLQSEFWFLGLRSAAVGKLTRPARQALIALLLIASIGVPVLAQQTPGLETTRTAAGEATAEFHRVESALHEAAEKLEENRAVTQELRADVDVLKEAVITTAVVGFTRSLEVPEVVKSGSPVNAVRADALGDAAIGADDDAIDSYSTALADLKLLEGNLAEAEASHQKIFAEVKAAYDEITVELERLEALEDGRLERVRLRAEEAERNGGVFVELTACPLAGIHTFIDSWGFSRSGGRRHKGVDMMAKTGVPIVAPVDGTVAHRSNRVGGRSFHLIAVDGTYFYGTHLSAYGASGSVKAGDIIGYVGDDGNAAGLSHLHLEIHPKKGSPTNPYPSVAVVCEGAS
jgi:murein DD-endopeptidase MepM/ murein hydrolase activator NlpD